MLTAFCFMVGVGLLGVGLFRLGHHREREDCVSPQWLRERRQRHGTDFEREKGR